MSNIIAHNDSLHADFTINVNTKEAHSCHHSYWSLLCPFVFSCTNTEHL